MGVLKKKNYQEVNKNDRINQGRKGGERKLTFTYDSIETENIKLRRFWSINL